jgi:hypothetical protein
VEAVGSGDVTANVSGPDLYGCPVELIINGIATNSIHVEDGDAIEIELVSTGNCICCRTKSSCASQAASMFVQKSNKDGTTISLDKRALFNKVRMAAEKVRGKSRRRR